MSEGSATASHIDRSFVKTAMSTALLEKDHEQDLARRWRDEEDEAALHELTSAYMRLVISMTSKFRNYGLPLSDLVQEGNVGLMMAAARFEPDRDVRFSTYASWWIKSCIQDFVLRNWSIVRTGTTAAHKSLFFNLRRLRAKINDVSDTAMTPENKAFIAEALNVREVDVEVMSQRLFASDRSLNAPLGGEDNDGGEWQDILPDEAGSPEEVVMAERDTDTRKRWLAEALQTLTPRESGIIRKRRLIEEGQTLESIGRELGISKERVRQIEHAAMKKLRAALERIAGNPIDSGLIPEG